MYYRLLLILLFTAQITACADDEPAVSLAGERFNIEIADDDQSRAQGLMFRDSMADDHGMLFLFPTQAPRSFWMKNTRIPLDIFYFDEQLKLVSVSENVKPCRTPQCRSYPSTGPAKYVLELNAGKAQELGVKTGDEITFHNVR